MRSIRLITRPRHQCLQQEQVYQSSLIAAHLPPRRALVTTTTSCARPSPHKSTMDWSTHRCDIPAEPLHRYQRGGYHPVHLGDCFEGTKGRKYRVLHKLGWGGYSTVWAARDIRNGMYVAIKISVSEPQGQNRESTVLQTLATAAHANQPGYQYLMMMKDFFEISGPNGRHECLVLELLGPSVADYLDAHSYDERLPGVLAKSVVKQTLLGLAFLHGRGIAHGDLHTRNLAFTIPSLQALREEDFLHKLGRPETAPIHRTDNQPLESSLPRYLVRPTSYHQDIETFFGPIKIIDFGQSFLRNESPDTLHTPFPYRAPEIIFRDKIDYRVDLWSMGCLFFELLTAQTIFDNMVPAPALLVRQMLETVSDNNDKEKPLLPERWKLACQDLLDNERRPLPLSPSGEEEEQEDPTYTLHAWLEETYYNSGVEKRMDFSREEILQVGKVIGRMLRLEPLDREEAKEVVRDEWFC